MYAFSFASNNPQYRVVRYFTDDERIYVESLRPKKEVDDLARRGVAERLSRERSERLSRGRLIREDKKERWEDVFDRLAKDPDCN